MENKIEISNNEKLLRFETGAGDDMAVLEYRFYKNSIALMHTAVPESMKGQGVASALAAFAFQFAKEIGKPVMVYCPFVAAYVKKHEEVKAQLDKEYHQ